jgi:hypothetical protein
MPFTVKEFPGQTFRNILEWEEAKEKRREVERSIAERSSEVMQVTATVIPASKHLLEKKVVSLEKQILELAAALKKLADNQGEPPAEPQTNKEGLKIGTILQGESRGQKYTLEVLDEGYLCSNGSIYQSLSGAALGVSGNRRSGWKFWKDIEGNSVGATTGRFHEGRGNPFHTNTMS